LGAAPIYQNWTEMPPKIQTILFNSSNFIFS
jgi:hypothetical protein